ncbi:hypothetical protein ABT340_39460 [Streptosporangium sp. NPDC000239]|uniref:hypothetical protein n=1 Tax=Streptosporangium sp. NPDC000239 TaxID=3154248 RepID=UPI00332FB6C3
MTENDPVVAASERYLKLQQQADEAKRDFFALCAERVRSGQDSADTLALRTFSTAVTIRKELRARGVEALPPGPKGRKTSPGE